MSVPGRVILLSAMSVFLVASFYIPTPPLVWLMALTGLSVYAVSARGAAWASPPA